MRKRTKVLLLLVVSVTVFAGIAYLLLKPSLLINPWAYWVGCGRDGGVTGCLVSGNRESALHRLKVKLGW